MSDHVLPQRKMPKLIVVMAFDKDEDGNLFTAFGPADQRTEERAVTRSLGRWPTSMPASLHGAVTPIPILASMAHRQRCTRLATYQTWSEACRGEAMPGRRWHGRHDRTSIRTRLYGRASRTVHQGRTGRQAGRGLKAISKARTLRRYPGKKKPASSAL